MASFTKINQFVQDLVTGKHDFSSHVFKVMLSNTLPNAATGKVKADVTEIAAGNGYSAGGFITTITNTTQVSGIEKPIAANVTVTAAGGSIGPFQYVVLYNSTTTTPLNPLVDFWDLGAPTTLNNGDVLVLTFDATNGLFQLS